MPKYPKAVLATPNSSVIHDVMLSMSLPPPTVITTLNVSTSVSRIQYTANRLPSKPEI